MAQLQEAQFACFEDEEVGVGGAAVTAADSGSSAGGFTATLRTFAVAEPSGASRSLPPKSFARVRALECSGSGSFYFQNDALKDRFICWRVIKNMVVLREWSLHETLAGNGVRLQFAAPVVATGVFAVESWEGNTVTIGVVTHAGSIHRFTYAIPVTTSHSIFTTADASSSPPKPATAAKCDVVSSLAPDELLTVALWVNEYNLVLGADSGRVLGVNFGLPVTPTGDAEMQEFAFSDASVVAWLWNGLVKSSAVAKWQQNDDRRQHASAAVVAVACFPLESDVDDDADDVCVVTVSADLTLRAWSYASQSCLGKQDIRALVSADDEDEGLDAYAVSAKIVVLPATSSDNCRLLVHIDTTATFSQDILLLRGDVSPLPNGGRRELSLTVARVFSVNAASAATPSKRLRLVDFAVDKNYLYSSWRSATGDVVYSHANPMALTGPRLIRGEVVSSLNAQMHKYDTEDDEWPFDLKDDDSVVELMDNFFVERLLLPGRFSRHNLYKAILEYRGEFAAPLRPLFGGTGHQASKYKDVLVQIVSDKCASSSVSASETTAMRHAQHPQLVRIGVWKSIIELCNKHWRVENVLIGFAATSHSLLPGSPVLLRRNRVALLFPSAASITTPFLATLSPGSADCVRELLADILPVFDGFPSRAFRSFIHREVTDVLSDWKVESFAALARHCVRLGLQASGTSAASGNNPDLALTRALLRLSKLLGAEPEFHDHVLRDLVAHLFPFDSALESVSSSTALSPTRRRCPSFDDSDEDQAMDDATDADASSSSSSRHLFGGNEMCFAFEQVAARTVDAMCAQALRVVLFLSYLVDTQPAFVSAAVLRNVSRFYLPRAITSYQRWRLSKWVASQNIAHATELDAACAKASAALLPPLLQLFLREANSTLNASAALKRARTVLQIALANNSNAVRSEEAQSVLGAFTREVLRVVAQPSEPLVRFLQKRKQFALLRAMLSCSLSDVSLHTLKYESPDQGGPEVHRLVRAIGECLAREGLVAAHAGGDTASTHAHWCFQQATRCLSICLSAFLLDHDDARADQAAERFIYDTVGLLKETVPRGFFAYTLEFLWAVVAHALPRAGDSDSAPLQTFVWVNVFKFSVEERRFRDAHLALMHTLDVSSAALAHMNDDSADGATATATTTTLSTSAECVTYLVKELCQYGHLDLICELQWGALEPNVEAHLAWQAANANVVAKDGSVDPSVVRFHHLLFAFYARNHQPANAAAAMHALFLRLQLAPTTTSTASLRAQRDALLAASNALLALPLANRWLVRKFHAEELPRRDNSAAADRVPLNIVTSHDIARELAVLDGKMQLLHLGRSADSALLSAMDGDDVVALLVDAALACCDRTYWTARTKQQESAVAVELARDIATKSAMDYSKITKSIARYCVSVAHATGFDSLCWQLLHDFLRALDSDSDKDCALTQYHVAAATILEWKVKLVLPSWLYARLAHRTSGNPAKLLRLFLTHGLLLDALTLADAMVPDELLSESESGFRQRVDAPSASLPWLPYNLFDALLDSVDAVVRTGTGHRSNNNMELRGRVTQFKEKLTSYFKYVALLEEARAAAGAARNASGGATAGGSSSFRFGGPFRVAGVQ